MLGISVGGLDHVHVRVADREKAAAWFGRVLGLYPDTELSEWASDPKGRPQEGTRGPEGRAQEGSRGPQGRPRGAEGQAPQEDHGGARRHDAEHLKRHVTSGGGRGWLCVIHGHFSFPVTFSEVPTQYEWR